VGDAQQGSDAQTLTLKHHGPLRNVAPAYAEKVLRARLIIELRVMLVVHRALVEGTIHPSSPWSQTNPHKFYRDQVLPLLPQEQREGAA
jgi:hypothetical protein